MFFASFRARLRIRSLAGRWTALALSVVLAAALISFGVRARRPDNRGPGQSTLLTYRSGSAERRGAPLRIEPARQPLIRMSAEEARWLDAQISPPPNASASVSECYHLLRAHGVNGRFAHPDVSSFQRIIDLLTNEKESLRYFGRPALVRTRHGVRFPTKGETSGPGEGALEAHRDQGLAVLAEQGFPLSHPLSVAGESYALVDVLLDSISSFHLQQRELSWTALAYALYLPPTREWTNKYGEKYGFDDLTRELIKRSFDEESCAGTHLLYAMTILDRVNAQTPILSDTVRAELRGRLQTAIEHAIRSQSQDGSWPIAWYDPPSQRERNAGESDGRLLATGHLAEWMLYLPDDLRIDGEVMRRAGCWLNQRLREVAPEEHWRSVCPFTHAVCVVKRLTITQSSSNDRNDGQSHRATLTFGAPETSHGR
jgi:hypothetical protein